MICNECRKEEPPDNGLAPRGWFTAWRRGADMSDHHFCTPACAATFFQRVQAEDAKAAEVAAAASVTAAADHGLRLQ